jgi:inhibitor of cysteine peptidase
MRGILHGSLLSLAVAATPSTSLGFGSDGGEMSITVLQGSQIVLTMPANPSTGFQWSSPPVAMVSGLSVNSTSFSELLLPGNTSGANKIQRMIYDVNVAGDWDIELGYSRPWESYIEATRMILVHVTVLPDGSGDF